MEYKIFNNYIGEPIDVYALINTRREVETFVKEKKTNTYTDITPPPQNRPVRFYCEVPYRKKMK